MSSFHRLTKTLFLVCPIIFLNFTEVVLAGGGNTYGRCNKLIISGNNFTDKCDGRVWLNSAYSYQKPWPIGFPQPPFSMISLNPGSKSENSISFNLDKVSYFNDSEAELTVNSVSVFSENREPVAATGSCKFQGLNTSQPEFLCNAKSKEAVPRIFTASFTYDESRVPEVFRDHGDALSRVGSIKSSGFRDFVVFARKLFENPDGLCANPVNQSKDFCAKIVDRSGAQKYPTRKSNNTTIPAGKSMAGKASSLGGTSTKYSSCSSMIRDYNSLNNKKGRTVQSGADSFFRDLVCYNIYWTEISPQGKRICKTLLTGFGGEVSRGNIYSENCVWK